MQAKRVQLAALEPCVSCVLEAAPKCEVVGWDKRMCRPGNKP